MTGPAQQSGFCRDCFAPAAAGAKRCGECGKPRLLFHPELKTLGIAHLDCDAFYAAIEKRDHPELRDKPLIIGGGKRGVVSTACYIARIHGVKSAMPMFKARQACPQAVVMPPDMPKYARVGQEVRALMRELTPLVQAVSIDEAFLDLTGTERLHHADPALSMARLARRIETDIGITVSVGLSYNKFLAKIASDLDKPKGFSVIGRAEATAYLARQPVSLISGVGKAFRTKLARQGITHIGQLQHMEEQALTARYGAMGRRLYYLARGQDDRSIVPDTPTKSISAETTLSEDVANFSDLDRQLWQLCEKVARRLKKANLGGKTVVLKLKTARFRSRTRNRGLSDPTQLADVIYRTASLLLKKEADGTPFRLIGVGLTGLVPGNFADPHDFLDPAAENRQRAERAMDRVRARFGDSAILKGRALPEKSQNKPQQSSGSK